MPISNAATLPVNILVIGRDPEILLFADTDIDLVLLTNRTLSAI